MNMREIINLVESHTPIRSGWSFSLPPEVIVNFDDPYAGLGDEGYSVDDLVDEIRRDGSVHFPIQVGRSADDIKHSNDHRVYAFNGNHRLKAAQVLQLPFIPCINSEIPDAIPLTVEDVIALGGHIDP